MKLDNSPTPPVTAPEIVEFWRENLKTQFNARMGIREVTEKGRFPAVLSPCIDQSSRSRASEETTSDQRSVPHKGSGGFPPG